MDPCAEIQYERGGLPVSIVQDKRQLTVIDMMGITLICQNTSLLFLCLFLSLDRAIPRCCLRQGGRSCLRSNE